MCTRFCSSDLLRTSSYTIINRGASAPHKENDMTKKERDEQRQLRRYELQQMSSLATKIRNGQANWVDDCIKEMYRNGYQHSKSKYFNDPFIIR